MPAGGDRLGLQGERHVAAGRGRRGHPQGRRQRALVLGQFGAAGGPQTLVLPADDEARLLPRVRRRTTTASTAALGAGFTSAAAASLARTGAACLGPHRGLVRATLRARCARTRCGEAVRPAAVLGRARRLRRGRAARQRDRLGDARPRRAGAARRAVPAGLTAMQALDRVAESKTRTAAASSVAVDGAAEHGRRAWFYFVNGFLGDQGAAEYRLQDGDVEWWDYRSWRDPLRRRGRRRRLPGAVPARLRRRGAGRRWSSPSTARSGSGSRRLVGGSVARTAPRDANVVEHRLRSRRRRFSAELRRPGAGSPVRFVLDARFASRLASKPAARPLPVLGAVSPAPAAALLAGARRRGAARRSHDLGRGDRARLARSSACARRARGGGSTSSARCSPGSASSCQAVARDRSARTCSGPGRSCRCSASST